MREDASRYACKLLNKSEHANTVLYLCIYIFKTTLCYVIGCEIFMSVYISKQTVMVALQTENKEKPLEEWDNEFRITRNTIMSINWEKYSCYNDINNSWPSFINITHLHINTHKLPHNEHLKASSVLVILEATSEFIKKLPLATEVWEMYVDVCVVLTVESVQRLKQLNYILLT